MSLKLTTNQKRVLAVLLLAGGTTAGKVLSSHLKKAQQEQKRLCADLDDRSGTKRPKKAAVAVDKLFFKRLIRILTICVPTPTSPEAMLILAQGVLLVSRTLLTDKISRIESRAGRHLIALNFERFVAGLAAFAGVAVPAAVVNSGLKYLQKCIQLAFMNRLTRHLHQAYCSNRAYYSASVLGGLTHADQRITEDVEKFSAAIAELYSYTVKPTLDVALFTRSLSRTMGYRGQLGLYAYYLASAALLRALSPPLALMTAQETALAGTFRSAHQRLVSNAEEVAYNDPPAGEAEQMILNQLLVRMLKHARLSALQRFIQQVFDGYLVKYFASVVALLVYAAPLYFRDPKLRGTQGDLTQDYIRSMRLLQNTSRGVGDLVLVYKRVTGLAGHTSRVAELLEQVQRLSSGDPHSTARELYLRNVSSSNLASGDAALGADRADLQRHEGDTIEFHRVALNAPDGTPLVRDLSFEVPHGRSILIMGPNGSGKSSLFRVLAGLWPLQGGDISAPGPGALFYLSQRPYLVPGTLRDQLLYPFPPLAVWRATPPAHQKRFAGQPAATLPPAELETRLSECLAAVELSYLLDRGRGWDQVQVWGETLSGGEKQRLAMARLLFHRPAYAVLDEATAAVSADGETALYRALCAAGITLLSIAHRPALRAFHAAIIHFEGSHNGSPGWRLEELQPPPLPP